MVSGQHQTHLAKASFFAKAAVSTLFLGALVWGIGAFAFLICSMLSAMSCFFYVYYKGKTRSPAPPVRDGETKNQARLILILKRFVHLSLALAASVLLFVVLVFFFSDNTTTPHDTSQKSEGQTPSADDAAGSLSSEVDQLTTIGNDFYANGQYDSALKYYHRILELDNRNSAAYFNKGLVYYNLKQYSTAIESFLQCLQVDAANKEALYMMGNSYYDQQQYDNAFVWFKQAHDAGVKDAFLHHALGYLYEEFQHNTTQAIWHYQQALALDSGRVDIYPRLEELDPVNRARYHQLAQKFANP